MAQGDVHDQDFNIKFKQGLAANINATATQGLAVQGEPHWTTDTNQLYVFDGTQNLRVPTEDVNSKIVFNKDNNVDGDFQVKGSLADNLILTDSELDRVGIGTSGTPGAILQVRQQPSDSTRVFSVINEGGGNLLGVDWTGYIYFGDMRVNSGDQQNSFYKTGAGSLGFTVNDGGQIRFSTWTTGTNTLAVENQRVGINASTTAGLLDAQFHVKSTSTTTITEIIQASASQTANLTEWRDSSATVLSSISKDGVLYTGNNVATLLSLERTVAGQNAGIKLTNQTATVHFGLTSTGLFGVGTSADITSTALFTVNPTTGQFAIGSPVAGPEFFATGTYTAAMTGATNVGFMLQNTTAGEYAVHSYRAKNSNGDIGTIAKMGIANEGAAGQYRGQFLWTVRTNGSLEEVLKLDSNKVVTSYGGRVKNTTRVTTTYTILVSDEVVFANTDSGAYTVTLPVGVEGQTVKVINSGSSANNLTLAPDGSEHLLGANSNFTLADGETLVITYNAADGWY